MIFRTLLILISLHDFFSKNNTGITFLFFNFSKIQAHSKQNYESDKTEMLASLTELQLA